MTKNELSLEELDAVEMSRELTDAELEAVAGGKDTVVNRPGGRPRPRPRPR
jgi:hypothetical protein